MTRAHSVLVALLAATACSYAAPLDPDADPVLNVISGDVVIAGDVEPADVVLLLFDADGAPRPPESLGQPLSFSTVPAEAFTGDNAGLQAADYAFTQVPDGDYFVTAVLDADGDFLPLVSGVAGATCGDWGGYHVADFSTLAEGSVTVRGGELVDNVTVVVAQEFTIERPAFEFASDDDRTVSMQGLALDFNLRSVAVRSELTDLDGPDQATEECITGFLVNVEDLDGDGAPDPHFLYGTIDIESLPEEDQRLAAALVGEAYAVWPRVYAIYTGEGDTPLEPGELWVTEAIHDPDTVTGAWPANTPFPVADLNMTFIPAGQHVLPDGTAENVYNPDLIPKGAWSILVVQITGQTWQLPNALPEFDVTSPSFNVARQAEVLVYE